MKVTMNACRACTSRHLYNFLSLGDHPPANYFLDEEQRKKAEPVFPLEVFACLDCGLIEIPDQIPADFFTHYLYVPSASTTMHKHFSDLAVKLTKRFLQAKNELIVDIGSNDGLFLGVCKKLGANTLGIEPAVNIAALAREKGVEVFNTYFNDETAREAAKRWSKAKVIVTTNTFSHIDDLHTFMKGVSILLRDDGVFVVEVPCALDLVEKNEFDTVYHEHLSTFSLKSISDLFHFFDMEIFDIERLEIHGGSMRIFGQKKSVGGNVSPKVATWITKEDESGLFKKETYDALAARVKKNKEELIQLLAELKKEGKHLAGYGAPAKGNTLLNYYGIGTQYLDYLADKNPLKHGRLSPGMHVPIVSADKIAETHPDYLLILAWNFSEEIMSQQEAYRRKGGKFILPIPELQIVE